MKKIIKLSESDLFNIVKKIMNESISPNLKRRLYIIDDEVNQLFDSFEFYFGDNKDSLDVKEFCKEHDYKSVLREFIDVSYYAFAEIKEPTDDDNTDEILEFITNYVYMKYFELIKEKYDSYCKSSKK